MGALIDRIAGTGPPLMVFVGNMGCVEIQSGPIETVRPTGPVSALVVGHSQKRTDYGEEDGREKGLYTAVVPGGNAPPILSTVRR